MHRTALFAYFHIFTFYQVVCSDFTYYLPFSKKNTLESVGCNHEFSGIVEQDAELASA
jgi:hypothetical protein